MLADLEDYGLVNAQVSVLENAGRCTEAAVLSLGQGKVPDAIRLFLKANDAESQIRAAKCLRDSLWMFFPLLGISREDETERGIRNLAETTQIEGLRLQGDDATIGNQVRSPTLTRLAILDLIFPTASLISSNLLEKQR